MGKISFRLISIVSGLCFSAGVGHGGKIDFERDVQPILAEKCMLCHGPDDTKGGLRLTALDFASKTLDSGERGIVPGDPHASEVLARVRTDNPDDLMPPPGKGEPLSPEEAEKLEQWIAEGADWPKHWAYRELLPPEAPAVADEAWKKNPVDAFVLSRLEDEGIAPSPQADEITLIRRLFYDLAGLPPSPEETEAYRAALEKDHVAGMARLVDDLLESPAFGERWGRHWLDRARYADSDGYEKDNDRPDAWRYRDWVISAINDDMPFDRFSIEQFAGDLLEDATPEQVLATAFHRQTLTNSEGGVDKEQWRVAAVMDRVETTGAVWMGLTLTCARCHTHKYDDITHQEYFQIYAYLNNGDEATARIRESDDAWTRYEAALAVHADEAKEIESRVSPAREELAKRIGEWGDQISASLAEAAASKEQGLEPITVEGFAASRGVEFSIEKDGSVVVGGRNPATATYTVNAKLPAGKITGMRLEVLPDASLDEKGPGRAKNGNFVLNRVEVSLGAKPGPPLPLGDATADYTEDAWEVRGILDDNARAGKNGTGWAVGGKTGQPHHADFGFAEAIDLKEETKFTLQLVQNFGSANTIGRFRLFALTTPTELSVPEPVRAALALPAEKRDQEAIGAILRHVERLDPATRPLLAEQAAHEAKRPAAPIMNVRVINERANERRATHVMNRGEFNEPLEEVQPGTLAVLPPIKHRGETGDRLDFARWLVGGENPLPPRVIANDVWIQLFGEGLVPTPDDFGVRGDRPSHPDLLEWLAYELVRSGWSRKALIRTIALSNTYQQASHHRPELFDIDPKNTLLARQSRFRVEAEIIRDISLSASGLLSRKVGGPSVFPPIPDGVADVNYNSAFKWNLSKGEDRYRRGMYTYFKRTAPHPGLTTLDCPDSNVTTVQRSRSNTPLGALITLNSESFVEAAQALASRVLVEKAGEDDLARIEHVFRLCLAREPTPAEGDRLVSMLESSRAWYRGRAGEASELAGDQLPEGLAAEEVAAWTATVRVVLNLDEFLTRG